MSAVVTLNAHGVIEACSPATAHLFGSAVEALIGCPVTWLMPAASGAAYEEALAQ